MCDYEYLQLQSLYISCYVGTLYAQLPQRDSETHPLLKGQLAYSRKTCHWPSSGGGARLMPATTPHLLHLQLLCWIKPNILKYSSNWLPYQSVYCLQRISATFVKKFNCCTKYLWYFFFFEKKFCYKQGGTTRL